MDVLVLIFVRYVYLDSDLVWLFLFIDFCIIVE